MPNVELNDVDHFCCRVLDAEQPFHEVCAEAAKYRRHLPSLSRKAFDGTGRDATFFTLIDEVLKLTHAYTMRVAVLDAALDAIEEEARQVADHLYHSTVDISRNIQEKLRDTVYHIGNSTPITERAFSLPIADAGEFLFGRACQNDGAKESFLAGDGSRLVGIVNLDLLLTHSENEQLLVRQFVDGVSKFAGEDDVHTVCYVRRIRCARTRPFIEELEKAFSNAGLIFLEYSEAVDRVRTGGRDLSIDSRRMYFLSDSISSSSDITSIEDTLSKAPYEFTGVRWFVPFDCRASSLDDGHDAAIHTIDAFREYDQATLVSGDGNRVAALESLYTEEELNGEFHVDELVSTYPHPPENEIARRKVSDFEYWRLNRTELCKKHPGKWLGIGDRKVISIGDSDKAARLGADKAHKKVSLVVKADADYPIDVL